MYKERVRQEYKELKEKHIKLGELLERAANDELGFNLNCPINLLEDQYDVMSRYLNILEVRAGIEDIEL